MFYFYSLHVSGNHVPIIRRIIVLERHLVYATLVDDRLVCRSYQTVIYTEWYKPGVTL